MPRPKLFRIPLMFGILAKPFVPLLKGLGFRRLAAMLKLVPAKIPPRPPAQGQVFAAEGERKARVALLTGCVAPVLTPQINEAATRVLTRHGVEVALVQGEGCCGSLAHHMGRETEALAQVRNNVDAWIAEKEYSGLDAILITASGCGTTIKDYGFMLRNDPAYAEKAAAVSAMALDISEYLAELPLARRVEDGPALKVAYHGACSLTHGQKVVRPPRQLLSNAGFAVEEIPEGHICCGSAGTYNMLQPELATQLRDRKIRNIAEIAPDVIAAGNIGCITQIASGTAIPVVHPVELVDWATGGPVPAALKARLSTAAAE
jgi:glycolate oxidase iron-sulfur subunit